MKTARIPVRIVFYREGGFWIAHCLEFDLVGNGKSKRKALDMLAEAIDIQVEATLKTGNAANLFRQADPKYHLMYAKGKDVAGGSLELAVRKFDHFELEPDEYREFTDPEADLVLA